MVNGRESEGGASGGLRKVLYLAADFFREFQHGIYVRCAVVVSPNN